MAGYLRPHEQFYRMASSVIITLIISLILLIVVAVSCVIFAVVQHKKYSQAQSHIADVDRRLVEAQTALAEAQNRATEAQNRATEEQNRSDNLNTRLIESETMRGRLEERISALNSQQELIRQQSELHFRQIASQILEGTTQKSDTRIAETLAPLKSEIDKLKTQIADQAIKNGQNSAALVEQIKFLAGINKQLSADASSLNQTLRGTGKIQGDWGEMILEQILENSGLERGRQFEVQVTQDDQGRTLTDSESGGSLRPDVVVNFPDGKKAIIDSKVSLKSYLEFANAVDQDSQKTALQAHLAAVKRNVDNLARKSYHTSISSAGDFVFMFIPNEGAFIAAMQADDHLWEYAYQKHVVIVSPTHLISVLRLVAILWQNDKQTKNVIAIADAGGSLYDKFVGFVDDMVSVKSYIDKVAACHDKAMKKLSSGRGNLISSVEKLKELGAKATKQLTTPKE